MGWVRGTDLTVINNTGQAVTIDDKLVANGGRYHGQDDWSAMSFTRQDVDVTLPNGDERWIRATNPVFADPNLEVWDGDPEHGRHVRPVLTSNESHQLYSGSYDDTNPEEATWYDRHTAGQPLKWHIAEKTQGDFKVWTITINPLG